MERIVALGGPDRPWPEPRACAAEHAAKETYITRVSVGLAQCEVLWTSTSLGGGCP